MTNDPIILFLDGHDSHESEKFQNTAFEHGIIVVAFPSKCTHNLQPLDVVVFSQTQHHWTKHCDYWLHKGVQMDRYNIIQEYMSVRHRSMAPKLLRSAFTSTGIFPLNPNVFTDKDFALAKASSQTMHVSKDFPPEVLSLSPIPSDCSDMSDLELADNNNSNLESDAKATAKVHFSQIDWSTDVDDYEPPLSPSTPSAPAVPTLPTTLADVPTMSDHRTHIPPLPQNMHPTFTSDVLMSLCHSHSSPFDDLVVMASTSGTCIEHLPHYFTCSQASQKVRRDSSPAMSISIALDPSYAPLPTSCEELQTEVCQLRMTLDLMARENLKMEPRSKQAMHTAPL